MASNINSSVINNLYPIAGQDNSTQGFRDNFTYIKNGLASAAQEITELQEKVILKTPLVNSEMDNDFANTPVFNMRLIGMRETVYNFGQIDGQIDLDFSVAHVFKAETIGSLVLAFFNWPQQTSGIGVHGTIKLCVQVTDVSHTIILPASVNTGKIGVSGISGNTVTFPSIGYYELVFSTSTAGVSVMLESISMPPNYFTKPLINTGTQVVDDGDIITFDFPHSIFSTDETWKAIDLPIAENGTTKTLIMENSGSGRVVVNVENPGWTTVPTTGSLTFDEIGQTCTLRVINQKWYIISIYGDVDVSINV